MKQLKKSIILMLLLCTKLSVCCAAMSYPLTGDLIVTSEYGWRTHPVFGTTKYHSGMDLGADYGQDVHAAAAGTVTSAGWNNGYGYCVIIDHGNGLETLYGHNETLLVNDGDLVDQGSVIALAGSTGYSTGPHCHFEVLLNGNSTDPMEYLDGSIPIPDGGSIFDPSGDFFKSDYNVIPLDFDSYYDFAAPLRDAINVISTHCRDGLQYIQDELKWLFIMLITMDLALTSFYRFFFDEEKPVFEWLIKKFLAYGFVLFMLLNWGNIVANTIREYFSYMGASAIGVDPGRAGEVISDPTYIVQKGAYIVSPIFTYVGSFHGPQILFNMGEVTSSLLIAFLILICFFLIGFQIMLSYLEFYIIALFSVATIPFSGFKYTKAFASSGFSALFQVSIKLMFFCFFAVMLNTTLENIAIDNYYDSKASTNAANNIDGMLDAIGRQESEGSGDYSAVNEESGAFGRYQILPENWSSWAQEAGLDPDAPMSPENQDIVARYKLQQYYDTFGNWRDVAIAWNGGPGAVGKHYSDTEAYANAVMTKLGTAGTSSSLNILLLFQLLLASLAFVFFGDRVSKTILRIFAGGGFKF